MYHKEQRHLWGGIVRISNETLREREQQYIDGMHDEQKSDDKKPQIFIDQLYKQRKQFIYEDILQEVNTLVMAVSFRNQVSMINNFYAGVKIAVLACH